MSNNLNDSKVSEIATSSLDNYGSFPPGTIVLAKLKSFPPWPAIVIPFELIPEVILKSKPKKSTLNITSNLRGRSKRKSIIKKNEEIDSRLWCVRFLKDDNFMWATIKDISLLTTEQIKTSLNSKKSKTIKLAYEMALNPPDLDEFIIYGSDGKPTTIDNETSDEDFVDDEEIFDDDEDQEKFDENDNEELIGKIKKRRKSTIRKPIKRQTRKSVGKGRSRKKVDQYEEEEEDDVDDDVDVDVDDDDVDVDVDVDVEEEEEEDNNEYDSNISDNEDLENNLNQDELIAINIPTSKEISENLKKKTPIIKKARLQFQSTLLTPPESTINIKESKNLINILDQLNSFQELPISLMKHYSLNKVLINALKKPELETKELKKLKNNISNFVKNWFNIEIKVDERWGFGYEEPKEENEVNNDNEKEELKIPIIETKEELQAKDIKQNS